MEGKAHFYYFILLLFKKKNKNLLLCESINLLKLIFRMYLKDEIKSLFKF